ncbi:hypothetical protein [Vibrio phage BONAISHI]|nr:hypothetical protein [Vibrio phage BONAISHI]
MSKCIHVFTLCNGELTQFNIHRPLMDAEFFFISPPSNIFDTFIVTPGETRVFTAKNLGSGYTSSVDITREVNELLDGDAQPEFDALAALKSSEHLYNLPKNLPVSEEVTLEAEASTSSAMWRDEGKADPFDDHYTKSNPAVAALHYERDQILDLCSAKMFTDLGAASIIKDHIRYWTRKLCDLESKEECHLNNLERAQLKFGVCSDDNLANLVYLYGDSHHDIYFASKIQDAAKERMEWLYAKYDQLALA